MVNKWTVYRHTSPSGKVYIGITSQNVERRWNSGKGYTLCKAFVRDKIRKAYLGIKLGDNVGFEKRSKSKDSYCKAVEQLDDTNNVIASFRSAIDAARYYNKGKSAASKITECCRGTRNKTLNNKWRYKYG